MKKPNYIVVFVLVLSLVYLFVLVTAKADVVLQNQAKEIHFITKLDLDKDGEISIKEAVAEPSVLAAFGKIDTDRNGKLSQLELKQVNFSNLKKPKIASRD